MYVYIYYPFAFSLYLVSLRQGKTHLTPLKALNLEVAQFNLFKKQVSFRLFSPRIENSV